jgi:hypothetical protein
MRRKHIKELSERRKAMKDNTRIFAARIIA